MNITWHGEGAVKLQTGDTTVLIDPASKVSGLSPLRAHVDIICLPDEKSKENIKSIKDPHLVIDGPGEYESKGIIIEGIEKEFGAEIKENSTFYVAHIEGMNVCHLGSLDVDLDRKQIDAIGNVDILLVPCGGNGTLDASKAVALSNALEPRIVIPIYYKTTGVKTKRSDVKDFLKEIGSEGVKPEKTFTMKKHQLPQEDTDIVVLEKS